MPAAALIPEHVRDEIATAFVRSAGVTLDFRASVDGLQIEYNGREVSPLAFVMLSGVTVHPEVTQAV